MPINYIIRLLNISVWYYIAAAMLLILLFFTTRKARTSILWAYLFILLSVSLFSRGMVRRRINLTPFKTYRRGMTKQIKSNILAYIPLGVVLKRKWLGPVISLSIEAAQFLLHKGQFDVDDIISNTIGILAGTAISYTVSVIQNRLRAK